MSIEEASSGQVLFAIGLNHNTAPVEVREKLYLTESEIPHLLAKLKQSLAECMVLSTCNRTEIYGVCESENVDLDFYKDLVIDFKNAGDSVKRDHFFSYISCSACEQLFNVATSVDSRIIGDTQILQQVRNAYFQAKENRSTAKILDQLTQRALKIGKRTYTDTSIHKGAVSISSAAVELAVEIFASLEQKSVMIVGAGETARLACESLINKRVKKIYVANRTRDHAAELLNALHKNFRFDSEIIQFDSFTSKLDEVDIVISSTSSPEPILRLSDLEDLTNKILLIDIAVPRDIDSSVIENKNVVLKNIDDLHAIVDRNHERRMADLPGVKKIVAREMGEFLMWYYSLHLMPAMEKTRIKPDREYAAEMLRIKEFLLQNASEFHKLARQMKGDVRNDLREHIQLVQTLKSKKAAAFEVVDA